MYKTLIREEWHRGCWRDGTKTLRQTIRRLPEEITTETSTQKAPTSGHVLKTMEKFEKPQPSTQSPHQAPQTALPPPPSNSNATKHTTQSSTKHLSATSTPSTPTTKPTKKSDSFNSLHSEQTPSPPSKKKMKSLKLVIFNFFLLFSLAPN
jgi:hypothetical protein